MSKGHPERINEIRTGKNGEGYRVQRDGVTRIEAITHPGLHSDIPYVQVWRWNGFDDGEVCIAEFPRHALAGIWFGMAISPDDERYDIHF